jgi:AcrR family transcriptional regulator
MSQPHQQLPSGRHGLPRRFVIRNQRERLLAATAQAVAAQGYGRTNVADIIAVAGVSRRTFYEHFADKEECFFAAYEAIVLLVFRAVEEAYSTPDDWPYKVRSGIEALVTFVIEEPEFARMFVLEAPAAGPAARVYRERVMALFGQFLEPGRELPATGVELPQMAIPLLVGGLYEIIYSRLLRDQPDQLRDDLPDMVYCALVPFIGHAQADEIRREVAGQPAIPSVPLVPGVPSA